MSRIALRDLTVRRLAEAVVRRVRELPHSLAWQNSPWADANRRRLRALHARHRGQRCFIMGNGPSLARMDLSALSDEWTVGLNRIYLLYDRLPFRPSYYACVNGLVLEQFAAEIRDLPMPKFLNWSHRRLFDPDDDTALFVKERFAMDDRFQADLTEALLVCGTVTYVALQTAYYLGFEEVILIGVDHNFESQGTPNTTERRTAQEDVDHFHPDYFPKGVKWQLPDLYRSELGYALARQAFEADGRRILDATVGGRCPVFERVDFASLFPGGS